MGKIVAHPGIEIARDYLYFVDKKGNVVRVQMKRAVKRKKGYLYYIDKKGNICELKIRIDGKKRKGR